jgi:hypothetical protein
MSMHKGEKGALKRSQSHAELRDVDSKYKCRRSSIMHASSRHISSRVYVKLGAPAALCSYM